MVTKKEIIKLLEENNIKTTEKTFVGLLIVALDNNLLTKEDLLTKPKEPKQPKELKKRGRPRKPPKEKDPPEEKDPKYDRLRAISKAPRSVTMTNVETGEVRSFRSQYKAAKITGKDEHFFARHNGKVVNGELIQLS